MVFKSASLRKRTVGFLDTPRGYLPNYGVVQPENRSVTLPDSLRRQFLELERRLWKFETALAISVGLIGLCTTFLALFLSDRFWNSPIWLRSLLFIVALVVIVPAAAFWMLHWVLKRRDQRKLAILVQKRFRRLGDRLLGIVELSTEQQHDSNFSPELYRAAIKQVAAEAEKYRFAEAVETRGAKRTFVAAGVLLGLTLLMVVIFPAASGNAFARLAAPFLKIHHYTLVDLEVASDNLIVPHGENFDVVARVIYRSFWRPSKAEGRVGQQPALKGSTENGLAVFHVPGQIQNGVLTMKLGDAEKRLSIVPSYRPSLKELTAAIQLPDYLKQPATNITVQNGTIPLLEGSSVAFHAKLSREIAHAELQLEGKEPEKLKVTGDEFSTEPLTNDNVNQFLFSWQDKLGLSNGAPWRLAVQPLKDLAPYPDLPEMARDSAILYSDVLNIRLQTRDDFGVNDYGISWDFSAGTDDIDSRGVTEMKTQTRTPHEKSVEKVFQWGPAVFGIPPDSSVELTGYARDYYPHRERVETPVYRIHVLGNEQHAELIRQQLEATLAQVEEIARMEDKIAAKTSELQSDKNSSAKQTADKIGATKQDQTQNAQTLEQLAREGMQTLREAMKNPVFKEQLLQDWAKNFQDMQKLSQENMQSASQDLDAAQKNAGDANAKEKNLADARQKEEDILKQLEKIQGKVNKGLDDLQALTLAQRLRRVSTSENEISGELQKVIPESIGLLPSELSPKVQRINSKLSDAQDDAQKETLRLEKEINRFFERTQKTNYGEVSKQMKTDRAAEELDRVRGMIVDNIGMEASRSLATLSTKFADWATKLEPPKQESNSNGGEGQGSGPKPEDLTKQLIALLRMREREMGIQQQTRLLDEQKGDAENYKKRADSIVGNQKKVTEELVEMKDKNQVAILARPFNEAHAALNAVEVLLTKPQTDNATVETETRSIDLLTDLINLINELAQRNPPPSSAQNKSGAEDMAFLMKMMAQPQKPGKGMPMKMPGGGNTTGGTTEQASGHATGNAQGKQGAEKTVQKASGAAGAALPVEFRDQLESYFKALEQEPE